MRLLLIFTFFLIMALSTTANAVITYSFTHIVEEGDTPKKLANGNIGESQLFVDVSEHGINQVLFSFRNTGPEPCVIKGVYFDNGPLLNVAGLVDKDENGGDSGVDFSQGGSPGHLPGGENLSPSFAKPADFYATADSPAGAGKKGVDPEESLGIFFDIKLSKSYSDVISGLNNGNLRIGLHVGSFASGGSESFVNNVNNPAPGAVLLGSIGVGLVGWMRRRRML